jgi:serine/threonine-protein phosphatase 4 regulatory subunit 1
MAPLLGGDLSRRVFLERFAALSADGLFHVRKICAANFGEFCAVVGQEVTESILVIFSFYSIGHVSTANLDGIIQRRYCLFLFGLK